MRSLELFSGAGGLAKGLEAAGFKHSVFVECNKHACATLAANFEAEKIFFGDIKDFDLDSTGLVDIVAGGPPCQPFSLGGKHWANQDSRGNYSAPSIAYRFSTGLTNQKYVSLPP